MSRDSLSVYSSVRQDVLKKTLFKGTFIALLGMVPLVYSTLYIGPGELSHIGMLLFFFGLAMIAVGMVPYRNLTFLEQHPNKLTLIDRVGLIYFHKGKKTLTIPFSAIDSIDYQESKKGYGIAIMIRKNLLEKIVVHNPSFNMGKFERLNRKGFGCDLFLQYFSRRSFEQIKENLTA